MNLDMNYKNYWTSARTTTISTTFWSMASSRMPRPALLRLRVTKKNKFPY